MKTLLIFFSALFISFTSLGQSPDLVISQVFWKHNLAGAPYGRKYVELFNRGTMPVSTAGMALQAWDYNWWVVPLPAVTIAAGQYFLVASNVFNPSAPDVVADYYVPGPYPDLRMTTNSSGVLLTSTTTNYSSTCSSVPGNNIIDRIFWADAAFIGCSETNILPYPGPTGLNAFFRKFNGCQDTDDNTADFEILPANPRNSQSPVTGLCNPGSLSFISAGMDIDSLVSLKGGVAFSKPYTLAAYNLNPSAGDITITPSQYFEVSTDNNSFSSVPVSIPYSSGQLSLRNIYVRISNTAPFGIPLNGTIINSGGSAANVVIQVHGTVDQEYFNTKADLGLENTATWSTTEDGTGPSPLDFTSAGQRFRIINQANATLSGVLNISGSRSKLILGDDLNAISLTIPAGNAYISGSTKLEVTTNTSLIMQNRVMPWLDYRMGDGSTIDFAQTGTTSADIVRIPLRSYYNLKLTNGYKYFSKDSSVTVQYFYEINTDVRHDLIVDAVQSLNGNPRLNGGSTINCLGDISFINGSQFEPDITGLPDRIRLYMQGTQAQHINTGGTDLYFSGMQVASPNVILSPNSNLFIGDTRTGPINPGSGILSINAGCLLSATGGTVNFIHAGSFYTSGRIACDQTSFNIVRSEEAQDLGSPLLFPMLAFTTTATVKDFYVNITNTSNDSFRLGTSMTVTGVLSLIKGKINVWSTGEQLILTATASVVGGSNGSVVEGLFRKIGTTPFTFPVGRAFTGKYAPVDISNFTGNDYMVAYYGDTYYYGIYISQGTLNLYPDYHVTDAEWWGIIPPSPGALADISFHYTDANSFINIPSELRMAHWNDVTHYWDDAGGTPDVLNTTINGKVTLTGFSFPVGFSSFHPFTLSAATAGVIPVKLSGFTARKENKSVKLYWTTQQEINSKEFIVERSLNQNKWDEVVRVNAAGNSSQKINYSATDLNPIPGINYYRLKQVDINGKFTYSEIRPVYFGNDIDFVLFPNPAKDILTVYLSGNTSIVSINIYNTHGQLVKHVSSAEESVQINLTGVAKGIYTIKITGKEINKTKKLVVD